MADGHKNFAYSTVLTAPSPATTGLSLVVQSGDGTKFPTPPFNATVWPAGVQPLSTNAEIVRVTAIGTDTFTLDDVNHNGTGNRESQEGSSTRTIVSGDQIAAAITAKTFTDIESGYVNSYSPFVAASGGTGLQTLASGSSQLSTGSLLLFPFKVTSPVRFNQIIIVQSNSYVFSAVTATQSNTYSSYFGIYSIKDNSVISLISSNSFAISETLQQSSTTANLSWNFPTSTATSGYGYGAFPAAISNQTVGSSYIGGLRKVGLQFGGEMSLTGNDYWLGILTRRTIPSGASTYGFSNAGIVGQIMNPINMPSTVSGPLPLGIAGAEWAQKNTNLTGWFGRNMVGIVTATSIPNFGGTRMPDNVSLIEIGGVAAGNTGSILPIMSFVST